MRPTFYNNRLRKEGLHSTVLKSAKSSVNGYQDSSPILCTPYDIDCDEKTMVMFVEVVNRFINSTGSNPHACSLKSGEYNGTAMKLPVAFKSASLSA